MSNVVVLLAGGSGSRMRGVVADKVLEPLGGVPVLVWSVRAFLTAGVAEDFVIVHRDELQRIALAAALAEPRPKLAARVTWVVGGAERRDSVLNGLAACPAGTDNVFIHDGARPLVAPVVLQTVARAVEKSGAAVLAHRVTDTVKQTGKRVAAGKPWALRDLDRSTLWAMETPQAFRHADILAAYRRVVAEGVAITDDVAAATHAGLKVTVVENLSPNPKITTPADLAWCEFLVGQ